MQLDGITDIGYVRRENQDAYLIRETAGHALCVVCDGMGGPAGGRIASAIAVDTYTRELEQRLRPDMCIEELEAASVQAVDAANHAIREAAEQSWDFRHMGTTLVSAVSCEGGALVTNVGDSRAYYISADAGIVRVTRDHSVVQDMVERGEITPEEARRHPKRNLITRALGPWDSVSCDCFYRTMEPDSFLLLCTDGLVDPVSEQEILFEVLHAKSGEESLRRLVEIAKERGAPDNVTAVLMRNRPGKEG